MFQAQHGLLQADFALSLPQMGAVSMPLSLVKRGAMGSVTAVQPLFAGLKIVNGNKLARLGEEVGRLQLRKTEGEVREQTDAYFWQIVSIRENLATLDAVDRQLGEIRRQVELSVRAGIVTSNDLLRVELRQQEVASNRLTAENGLKVVRMLLAQHVGADWRTFDVAAAEYGEPEDPAPYYVPVEEALDNRAEYLLAEKNVEAQRYQTRMERGKRLPTVGVGAGYLYYNVTDKDGRRAGFRPGIGPHLRLVGRRPCSETGAPRGAAGRERAPAGPRDAGRGDRAGLVRGAGGLCADCAGTTFGGLIHREPAAEPGFLCGGDLLADRTARCRDALCAQPRRDDVGLRRLPYLAGPLHAGHGALTRLLLEQRMGGQEIEEGLAVSLRDRDVLALPKTMRLRSIVRIFDGWTMYERWMRMKRSAGSCSSSVLRLVSERMGCVSPSVWIFT